MINYFSALLFTITLSTGLSCFAQANLTPEDTAKRYVEAIQSKGVTIIPEFIHPDELEQFKSTLLPLMRNNTDIEKSLRSVFFGPTATAESLASMSNEEFMRSFMRLIDGKVKHLDIKFGNLSILGSVKEDDVIHLVTRHTSGIGDVRKTKLEIISLRTFEGEWKLMLKGNLEGIAQTFKSQIETMTKEN